MTKAPFHLPHFLPYLLNQASEAASREFQAYYRARYGMLRTEWRVVFHLGCYGPLSAKQICEMASIHKTKVSRAVAALERKRFLTRDQMTDDRRTELLSLTVAGKTAFEDLSVAAQRFEEKLLAGLSPEDVRVLKKSLMTLSHVPGNQ